MFAKTRARGLLLLAALLLASGPTFAEVKIGVVSFPRLLEEAPQAQEAMRQLQEEFSPRERDLRGLQEELRGVEDQLRQGDGFMGEEERRRLERQQRDTSIEITRRGNELREDLNLRRNEELARLQRMLIQEVNAFAQTESYDLVLAEGVMYASNAVDVTDRILASLEQRFQAERASGTR